MSSYAKMFGYKPVPFYRKRKPVYRPRPIPKNPVPSVVPRRGRRVRPKVAISYSQTKTKTKTKQKVGQMRKIGENTSLSSNYIGGSRFSPAVYQLLKQIAPKTITSLTSNNSICQQGRQQIAIFEYLNLTELGDIKTAISVSNRNMRLALQTGKVNLLLRNQTNCNCRMSIYDVVVKRDSQSTTYDTPLEAWTKSSADNGDANQLYFVGQTPHKSAEFRKFFAINKVTYVNLEAGQQHEHIVHHKYNKVVDTTRWDNTVGTSLAGLTRFIMVVFNGHLVHNNLAVTSVTTAPITIDWVFNKEYTFKWFSNNVPGVTITNNLLSNIVDMDQMGETQDADLDVNTA